MSVVMLLVLASVTNTARAEEVTRDARIEATLPRAGTVMVAGFDSLWMMNTTTNKLDRIHPGDNSVTEIPISGAGGGFVWVSTHAVPIIQIDPRTNSVRGQFRADMSEYSTIRFGGGSLWLSGGSVRRIEPPG